MSLSYGLTAQDNFEVMTELEQKFFATVGGEFKLIWLPHQGALNGMQVDNQLPTFAVKPEVHDDLAAKGLSLTAAQYELWCNSPWPMYRRREGEPWPHLVSGMNMVDLRERTTDEIIADCALYTNTDGSRLWSTIPSVSLRAHWFGICVSRMMQYDELCHVHSPDMHDQNNWGTIMAMISELFFLCKEYDTIFHFYQELMHWLMNDRKDGQYITANDLAEMCRTVWKFQWNFGNDPVKGEDVFCYPVDKIVDGSFQF